MQESTVSVEGQTTLPPDVRAALGLQDGDRVRYVILDGEVRIMKVQSVQSLRGVLARDGQSAVFEEAMDDAIARGASDGIVSKR
jgi:antitoxin PrlF